ncbi:MAG: cbb3-type cytochrome c oxidase subunit 3 [Thiolinea sp.]
MDLNDFRSLTTLLIFIAFLGVVFWAYSRKQKNRFDAAANSIFDQDEEKVHQQSVQEEEK